MVQTAQAQEIRGYFNDNWQFAPSNRTVKPPTEREVVIKFVDTTETELKTKSQKQIEALDRLLDANKALDEQGIEPLDDEFFAIINSGVRIDSGVDL